jgi:hypothetical protein
MPIILAHPEVTQPSSHLHGIFLKNDYNIVHQAMAVIYEYITSSCEDLQQRFRIPFFLHVYRMPYTCKSLLIALQN